MESSEDESGDDGGGGGGQPDGTPASPKSVHIIYTREENEKLLKEFAADPNPKMKVSNLQSIEWETCHCVCVQWMVARLSPISRVPHMHACRSLDLTINSE
jgi:hypothetical protein